ncbi:MAG: DNA starvation/stationary phase protection protein Dps [Verrucomicrobiota bacterium]
MKTNLHPTRIDLPESTRRKVINLLNQNLADVLDLGLQAKQAHWNVKGPQFIALHELFDKLAAGLEEFADDLAERAVALGGVALGTSQVIVKRSRLNAYPTSLATGKAHLEAIANALAQLGKSVRAAVDGATRLGDADTADLFTEISRDVDKMLWLAEAHEQADE